MILKFLAPGSFYGHQGVRWYKDHDGFSIPAESNTTGKILLPPYSDETVTPLDSDETAVLTWAAIVGRPDSTLIKALEATWAAEGLVIPKKPAKVSFKEAFSDCFKAAFQYPEF